MHEPLHPSAWPRPRGYANGIAAEGRLIFVAGQIGWAADRTLADDFGVQVEQALRNVMAVLAEAGAGGEHLVRLNWFVLDKREYLARAKDVGDAYRQVIGRHYPTMTLLQVSGFIEDRAKVEIEATAVMPLRAPVRA